MFKNSRGKIRSGWLIIGTFLLCMIILIFLGILFNFVTLFCFRLCGYQSTAEVNNFLAIKPWLYNLVFTLQMAVQEFVMIIAPVFVWHRLLKKPISMMGLPSIKKHGKELAAGLLFGIVSITAVFILLLVTKNSYVLTWKPHFSINIILWLFLFILVGLAEEILTRGFIMSVLRQTRSIPAVVIVSSIIFSLMHSLNSGVSFLAFLNIFLVGILFAVLYLWSGNIWISIGFHITWNFFQGNVFGFPVSGIISRGIITTMYKKNNIFNGGVFGPEGGIAATIILLIAIAAVLYYYKGKSMNFLYLENNANLYEEDETDEEQEDEEGNF